MSWSVNFIGTPERINVALDDESARLTGQSRIEFDDALPHLKALVASNFDKNAKQPILVKLVASGSGSADALGQSSRSATISIERMWSNLLL